VPAHSDPLSSGPDGTTSRALDSATVRWLGIGFCALYCLLIWALSGRLAQVPHLPDAGASWYYWLRVEATNAGRISAWSLYLAHQLANLVLIYYAQTRVKIYTRGLHPVNLIALGTNAVFVLLHVLQTHLWYDGLARDVSIWSALGSVAVLLIWVLLLENPRRGLFFGARLPLSQRCADAARKYHGYYFSWAIVYTFWYHPTEATTGHLLGFFYLLLILLQGCLFLTTAHLGRTWRLCLELLVIVHGTSVAASQPDNLWPMFFFGFGAVFVITQMHGLGWPRWVRVCVFAAFAAGTAWVYSSQPVRNIEQVFRIPLADYLGVLLLAGLISLGIGLSDRLLLWKARTFPDHESR
jgi:hypothetical protein